ncbi:hypothetical protein GWK47_001443 [Chionoecetes opilio]|uniref:Uncharacterized protein n=1 Tax=Chionoecetes opilio TaxID=41210 RepID=A0A8J4XUD5_CHIOP|nr:hypothetical protein GWK47_001443 [Chionoecetes opilio]
MAKGDLPLKSPSSARICATKHERGTDPVHDVYRHNVRGKPWVSPHARPRPPQGLALLKTLAAYRTRRSGARARCGPGHGSSPRGSSPPPSSTRGRGVEEKRATSAPCARLGGKNPPAAPTSPRRSGTARRRLRDQLCRPRHPLGGPGTFPNVFRPSGRGGTLTHGRRGARTYGGERFAGKGGSPPSAFCGASRATRNTTAPSPAGRGAPPGVVPLREIG